MKITQTNPGETALSQRGNEVSLDALGMDFFGGILWIPDWQRTRLSQRIDFIGFGVPLRVADRWLVKNRAVGLSLSR